jgi:hypothetical protein
MKTNMTITMKTTITRNILQTMWYPVVVVVAVVVVAAVAVVVVVVAVKTTHHRMRAARPPRILNGVDRCLRNIATTVNYNNQNNHKKQSGTLFIL